MKIPSKKISLAIMITWCIIYFIIGTYLIQDGKSPMPVNKETNNSVIEIFSGDVIKFGQGMALIFHIHDIMLNSKTKRSLIICSNASFSCNLDVCERSGQEWKDKMAEDKDKCVIKCIRYYYIRITISIRYQRIKMYIHIFLFVKW